jgi:type IV pilus assembly protein PilF
MRTGLSWLLLAMPAATLMACASLPTPSTGTEAGTAQEWITESDEPQTRRRARLRVELASGYFEQGKTTVALDEVKQALAADPAYAPAYSLRGLIYLRLQEPALAEASLRQAIKLAPRDGDGWHNLGWLLCESGRHAEASAAFASALQAPQYASSAKTWMSQGLCQVRAGKPTEAERSLMRAFELEPANPITSYNLASLLMQRRDHARAQFYIRRLNQSEMANAESLWLGARIEHRLGNREAARQLGELLRRRHSESQEAAAYERGAFHD